MAATIKVANRMPRAIQIAPGVVLQGATGTQPGITEGIDAEAFAKWRELMGESIGADAVYEHKGDAEECGKAVITGAGGIADKPSTDVPGVSEPFDPDVKPTPASDPDPAPAAPAAPAPAVAPAAKAQPAAPSPASAASAK